MEHGERQLAVGSEQQAEERGQTTEKKRFGCGSCFPRPEPVEGQPRSCALNDLNGFNDFHYSPFTAYCSLLNAYRSLFAVYDFDESTNACIPQFFNPKSAIRNPQSENRPIH
jgi:hypothetical protein